MGAKIALCQCVQNQSINQKLIEERSCGSRNEENNKAATEALEEALEEEEEVLEEVLEEVEAEAVVVVEAEVVEEAIPTSLENGASQPMQKKKQPLRKTENLREQLNEGTSSTTD